MELIIFTILLILVLSIIILRNRNQLENFTNQSTERADSNNIKSKIYNILPAFDLDFCGLKKSARNSNPIFVGTFLPDIDYTNDNLIYTRSLKSNTWYGPLKNSVANSNGIFIDLKTIFP